ncbi:MAG TPA: energy transducer TonB, partial [Sphingopyxis sp.]|nr:energy transducer TonB [Sphingopyxis sp.]
MAYTGQISGRQRALSGAGALIAVVAVGLGLAGGLDLDVVRRASETISAIAVPAPPPQEQIAPSKAPSERASGKASAPNEHAKATQITAPQPKLPPVTPPVAAAARPGTGADSSAG